MENGPVLVLGATGKQGGAVAVELLRKGRPVRALVRTPQSAAARSLAANGVQLFSGGFPDLEVIRAAMAGAAGVFSVQPNSGSATSSITDEEEVRFGKSVVDLALESNVKHLVYSSASIISQGRTGLDNLDCKLEIEEHVRRADIRSTIVRPASFMELMTIPGMGLDKGMFSFFIHPDQPMDLISSHDIGKIVVDIITHPDRSYKETISIAGDRVTGRDIQRLLTEATGRSITYQRFPESLLKENPFLKKNADIFENQSLVANADIPGLKQRFGDLMDLRTWLNGPGKPLLQIALHENEDGVALS
ncbi:NmrA/HSCARG family protein [Paracoccus liaowanqingii]|uniref:NmrA/HSCARG family protein n=1 Tax=Paracoccus liaowanqingii TaxID=2560053 RepID=A0A4Z1C757_9RHOB|nr:NmrA/HSCARG family protein [Paracoccus liaowanqingii]